MGNTRVLIVEDEAIIAFEMKMILERAGYSVTRIAYTAEDAMRAVESEIPGVIIMDILIRGDLDGISAAERINELHRVPILFITGNSQLVDEKRFANIKSYIIMSKPPGEADIIKNVRMLAGA